MSTRSNDSTIGLLSDRFTLFANRECKDSSPLYGRLSLDVSEDPELLALASYAMEGQPPPNLFFAAVQFLLFGNQDHLLASHYPNLRLASTEGEDPFPVFREFCLENRDAVRDLLATRRVQTNEPRRCAYMLPTFEYIASPGDGAPLSIIDVGAGAGLHLLWDRYRYDYGEVGQFGDPVSPVVIASEVRGEEVPEIHDPFPAVEFTIGIDLTPVNLDDPDARKWSLALIWPEHHERVELLRAAIDVAQCEKPKVVGGDVVEVLPEVLRSIPLETELCLYHSHILYQLSEEQLARYTEVVRDASHQRDIYWISAQAGRVELIWFKDGGQKGEHHLANCEGHGRWFEWVA